MTEPALTKDPETGEPIRRVIMGGYGILQKGKPSAAPAPAPRGGGCCGGACGCHH